MRMKFCVCRVIDKMSDSYVKRTVPGNVDYHEENDLDLSRFKYVFWVTSSSHMGESQPSKQLIFSPPPLGKNNLHKSMCTYVFTSAPHI